MVRDLTIIQTLFDTIATEDTENRFAIQETLSLMADEFNDLEPTKLKQMEAIVMQNVDRVGRRTFYCLLLRFV